jgi:EAL domain-containing protein (putative c-di-GMP-specific phosphodiesterase class I)
MLLQRLIKKGKLDLAHVVMKSASGTKFSAFLGACRLPNYPDRCFLSLSIRGHATGRSAGRGIPELTAFLPVLESRLISADATEMSQALSMILINGLQDAKADPKLREMLEAYFLSISTDGDSAVRLNEDQYAVLHSEEAALEDIQRDISQILRESNAKDLADSTQMWRLSVEKSNLPVSDVARAIAFTLKKFATENPSGLRITNIDSAVEDLLKSTVSRVTKVRTILDDRDFRLVFQPIVRLDTGELHHVEALMRLGESDSPADFVTFTERIGLHTDLDLLVIQAALDVVRDALGRRLAAPDISVNISAASLSSPLFLDQMEEILRPFGAVARKLLIEITETEKITDFAPLKAALKRLKRLSLQTCLDDIGRGNGAFMSINELRVDFVKLDGKIVHRATRESRDRTILHSIVQICLHLGIKVVAEQVETEEQRAFLGTLGIPYGQGFLFGRPASTLPTLESPQLRTKGR